MKAFSSTNVRKTSFPDLNFSIAFIGFSLNSNIFGDISIDFESVHKRHKKKVHITETGGRGARSSGNTFVKDTWTDLVKLYETSNQFTH